MSLRRRISLLVALAVGVAVALAASVSYVAVRGSLREGIDQALSEQAAAVERLPPQILESDPGNLPTPPRGGRSDYVQLVGREGTETTAGPSTGTRVALPVSARTRAIAAGRGDRFSEDVRVDGVHIRVLTVPVEIGANRTAALQLGRSLENTDATLAKLRLILVLLCALGVALAAVLGLLLAGQVVEPIRALTQTARHISQTHDLSRRIDLRARDEVAELAGEFNAMLDALQHSQRALDLSVTAQRQLVADASHELKTPVTILRANLELLEQADSLDPDDFAALLADLHAQARELGELVTDVIELARGTEPVHAVEDVRMDTIVRTAVLRARAHAPQVKFRVKAIPVAVEGVPDRLARAVNNLLDNAAKHGGPAGVVDVTVDRLGITVRDHGDGVPDEDLDHIFDRFYRSIDARGRAGTGLGLAIVKQVAETHGGRAEVTNASDGGACFRLVLPGTPVRDRSASGPLLAR